MRPGTDKDRDGLKNNGEKIIKVIGVGYKCLVCWIE